jgi:hypothetical protein
LQRKRVYSLEEQKYLPAERRSKPVFRFLLLHITRRNSKASSSKVGAAEALIAT